MLILYPECYTEKFLCEYLGYSKKKYEKCIGKPAVINKIQSSNNSIVAIEIVDEDPMKTQHGSYKLYKEVDTFSGLRLLQKQNSRKHFLLEFCGEFERWILYINKKAKIKPEDFDININQLHEYSIVNMPNNYKDFLKEIFEKNPAPIDKIKEWIYKCENM